MNSPPDGVARPIDANTNWTDMVLCAFDKGGFSSALLSSQWRAPNVYVRCIALGHVTRWVPSLLLEFWW